MTESQIYDSLRQAWVGNSSPPAHSTRIESWVTPGVPDTHWGCVEGSFWAELKVLKKSGKFQEPLKTEQMIWLLQHTNAGGQAWVLARRETDKLFFAWWGGDARRLFNHQDDCLRIPHIEKGQKGLIALRETLSTTRGDSDDK